MFCLALLAVIWTAPEVQGSLYVTDDSQVLQYTDAGGFVKAFVKPNTGGLDDAQGLDFGFDSNLYVVSYNTTNVMRYNGKSGASLPLGGAPGAQFVAPGSGGLKFPFGLVFGTDKNLYVVTNQGTGSPGGVMRYNATTAAPMPSMGNPGAQFVALGSGGLKDTGAVVVGPDGNLYVTSTRTDAIFRYNAVTGAPLPAKGQAGATFVPAGSGGMSRPLALVFGPDGNLYVTDINQEVLRFNGTTGAPMPAKGQAGATFVPKASGGLALEDGLIFGPGGNLFVAGTGIFRFNGTTGAPMPAAGQQGATFVPAGLGGLTHGNFLVFDRTDPTTFAYVPEPSSLMISTVAVAITLAWRSRSVRFRTGRFHQDGPSPLES